MGEEKRRNNIALFLSILENEISAATLRGATKAAKETGANLLVFPMDLIDANYSDKEVNFFRYQYNTLADFMVSDSIDGVIIEYGMIVSALKEQDKKTFLSKIGSIPTILLAEDAEGYQSICVDNNAGLKDTLLHLIKEHHCTKIGFISGPRDNHDAQMRLQVYFDTMREQGLPIDEEWVAYGNFSMYVEDVVTRFVKAHPDIEAIACANDSMAMGVYLALEKMGLQPGKDILVTGFDDIPSAGTLNPPLTTVKADPAQLSYRAVYALMNPGEKSYLENVPSELVIRESCGCLNHTTSFMPEEHSGLMDLTKWREDARERILDAERRTVYEHELGNITRDMIFYNNSERDLYESILKTLKRLQFDSCFILRYEKTIVHKIEDIWVRPQSANLYAYYKEGGEPCVLETKLSCNLDGIFRDELFCSSGRFDMVVLPLFFGDDQMGLMFVQTRSKDFPFAFQLACQVSNTLAIIDTMHEQERMKKELEMANQAKSQFLAHMSHEIRTPINSIIGFNEMILRENLDRQIEEYALDVKGAANALLALVNDILDFSKIEAGKMNLAENNYQLRFLMHDAISLMKPRAEKKGLKLRLEYDPSLPNYLYGDSDRIRQILLNLMSNGVKYTREGEVLLKVSGIVKGEEIALHFEIKDTGIGIKREDLAHLFEPFERLEADRNRHIEGTGLGINITVSLLKLMNSHLEVESEYNQGSTFAFTLVQRIIDHSPIGTDFYSKRKPTDERDVSGGFKVQGVSMLIVDDNAMNRKVLMHLLKNTGIRVDDVDSGRACIDKVAATSYDIIMLDHMMPQMDGIETLQHLKQMESFQASRPIVIALTANAVSGVKDMYLEKGFDDYLSKPVQPRVLYQALLKHIDPDKIIG